MVAPTLAQYLVDRLDRYAIRGTHNMFKNVQTLQLLSTAKPHLIPVYKVDIAGIPPPEKSHLPISRRSVSTLCLMSIFC